MQVYKSAFLSVSSFHLRYIPPSYNQEVMYGRGQSGKLWVYEDISTTDFPGEPFQSWKKNIKWTDWQTPTGRGKGNICLSNLYSLKMFFVLPASFSFTGDRALTKLTNLLTNYLISWDRVSALVGPVTLRKMYWPHFECFLKVRFSSWRSHQSSV